MVYEVNEYSGDGMTSGSSFSHHGILGMKWGVRRYQNPDGTLTAEGRARYYGKASTDKLAKDLHRYRDYLGPKGNSTLYARLSNSVSMKSIAASVRRTWEASTALHGKMRDTENKFFKRKDYDHWVRRAAETDWKKYNQNGSLEKQSWTFSSWLDWYLHDDGDQGERITRSFDLWLKESGEKEAYDYLKNERAAIKADRQYRTECKKAVQAFLGEHGNETYDIMTRWGNQTSVYRRDLADRGVDIVTNIMNTWDTYGRDFNTPVSIEDYMRLVN